MPEAWDPTIYRERAAAWRNKATGLPENSEERSLCVMIAEDYEKVSATVIEQRSGLRR